MGYFRIATTNWNGGGLDDVENNVFCFDYEMKMVGSLEGIGKKEKTYSTLFKNKRLYMVTFREIDPFFVISLEDHTKPKVLG